MPPQVSPPAASSIYELTDWGTELEPVIIALGRWGARSPSLPRNAELGVDSPSLSFRTMFDPGAAEGLEARYELRLGEESFRAVVTDGRFDIVRGRADHPDATIKTGAATLGGAGLRGPSARRGAAFQGREGRGRRVGG